MTGKLSLSAARAGGLVNYRTVIPASFSMETEDEEEELPSVSTTSALPFHCRRRSAPATALYLTREVGAWHAR